MTGGAQQPPQFLSELSQLGFGGFLLDNFAPFTLPVILAKGDPYIQKLLDNDRSPVPNPAPVGPPLRQHS